MPSKCSVFGCRSNYQSNPDGGYVTVFRFPCEKERRKQWLRAMRRTDWVPLKNSSVCIKHFREEDIIRSDSYIDRNGEEQTIMRKYPALKKDSVPSIFPYHTNPLPPRRKDPAVRKVEIERRDARKQDEMLKKDQLASFEELQSLYSVKLKNHIKSSQWQSMLEQDQYLLLYKLLVQENSVPSVSVSIMINVDLIVNVSQGEMMIPSASLKYTKNGKVDKWSQIENLLTELKSPTPALVNPVSVSEIVTEVKRKLEQAAVMLINDIDCGPSKMLECLGEQAVLAIAPDSRRRYSDGLRQFACILYAKSPTCYRYLRKSCRVALPHERTLKRLRRAPLQLTVNSVTDLKSTLTANPT